MSLWEQLPLIGTQFEGATGFIRTDLTQPQLANWLPIDTWWPDYSPAIPDRHHIGFGGYSRSPTLGGIVGVIYVFPKGTSVKEMWDQLPALLDMVRMFVDGNMADTVQRAKDFGIDPDR